MKTKTKDKLNKTSKPTSTAVSTAGGTKKKPASSVSDKKKDEMLNLLATALQDKTKKAGAKKGTAKAGSKTNSLALGGSKANSVSQLSRATSRQVSKKN